MAVHFGIDRALFDDRALFRKIPLQNGKPAVGGIGIVDGADQLVVAYARVFGEFVLRDARHRLRGAVEEVCVDQTADHGGNAARVFKFFNIPFARGRKAAQIGRLRRNFVHGIHGDLLLGESELACERKKVQNGVGGSADRHIDAFRVFERRGR